MSTIIIILLIALIVLPGWKQVGIRSSLATLFFIFLAGIIIWNVFGFLGKLAIIIIAFLWITKR